MSCLKNVMSLFTYLRVYIWFITYYFLFGLRLTRTTFHLSIWPRESDSVKAALMAFHRPGPEGRFPHRIMDPGFSSPWTWVRGRSFPMFAGKFLLHPHWWLPPSCHYWHLLQKRIVGVSGGAKAVAVEAISGVLKSRWAVGCLAVINSLFGATLLSG